MKKVAIIGDGIVGLCSAYFLVERGFDVEIISNSSQNQQNGCSYGNAGMIVPSHFVPLAAPGVIKQGLKWMLNAKSPLYIQPRFNKALIDWLWLFFQSANQLNVSKSKYFLCDMHLKSRDLFLAFSKKHEDNFQFQHKGLMMLYQSQKCQAEEEHLAEEAKAMGIPVKVYSSQEIAKLEPELTPNVLGGVLYKSDAHINPNQFMNVLRGILRQKKCSIPL